MMKDCKCCWYTQRWQEAATPTSVDVQDGCPPSAHVHPSATIEERSILIPYSLLSSASTANCLTRTSKEPALLDMDDAQADHC